MAQSTHSDLLDATRQYKIPPTGAELLAKHPPLILAGVTASGKDAVAERIIQTSSYRGVVTHTTRLPRPGEIAGQHYHFVSEDQMLELIHKNEMIEVQDIHGGTVYGISIASYQQVIDAGYEPLLIVDVQGIEEISKYVHGLRPFFILPPSFETWTERLDKRGHMSHVEKSRRFRSAREELEKALRQARFVLVINRDVSEAASEILRGSTDGPSQHHGHELIQLLIDHIKTY